MIEAQTARMIKLMKQKRVKNYEFAKMGILRYSASINDIRGKGINVEIQRIYDRNGKATGTFEYWIPKERSNFFSKRLNKLRG